MNKALISILIFVPIIAIIYYSGHLAHSLPILMFLSCILGHSLMHSGHHQKKSLAKKDKKEANDQ